MATCFSEATAQPAAASISARAPAVLQRMPGRGGVSAAAAPSRLRRRRDRIDRIRDLAIAVETLRRRRAAEEGPHERAVFHVPNVELTAERPRGDVVAGRREGDAVDLLVVMSQLLGTHRLNKITRGINILHCTVVVVCCCCCLLLLLASIAIVDFLAVLLS